MKIRTTLRHLVKMEAEPLVAERMRALVFCSDLGTRCVVAKSLLEYGVTPTLAHTDREVFMHLAKESCALVFCEDTFLDACLCDILKARKFQRFPSLVVLSSRSVWDAYLTARRTNAF